MNIQQMRTYKILIDIVINNKEIKIEEQIQSQQKKGKQQ